MLQNRSDAEELKVCCCCCYCYCYYYSADIARVLLAAADLVVIRTLPLGQPKWQFLGVTSPHFPLHPRFTAAKEPFQQVQGC